MVQLVGVKVPRQLGEELVHVLDDRLVFAVLRTPHGVQVVQREGLFFDQEAYDAFELLDVLDLVQRVAQHDAEHVRLFDPVLRGWWDKTWN